METCLRFIRVAEKFCDRILLLFFGTSKQIKLIQVLKKNPPILLRQIRCLTPSGGEAFVIEGGEEHIGSLRILLLITFDRAYGSF